MRHEWIDAIKGYGIILVVAGHTKFFFAFPTMLLYLTAGYMAMFFIASGYTTKKEPLREAIIKKAYRLLIPYTFYGISIALFNPLLRHLQNSYVDNNGQWLGLLYSRFSVYPLGTDDNYFLLSDFLSPLWFLTAMFVAFTGFYIYAKLRTTTKKAICIGLFFIATIAMSQFKILLPWSIDTALLCAIFIITGYELQRVFIKKDVVYNGKVIAALFALFATYLLITKTNGLPNLSVRIYGNHPYISIFLYYILSVLATILISYIFIAIRNTFMVKILSFVGKHSLRIMCIHMPIVWLSINYIQGNNPYMHIIQFLVAFSCTLIISILLEYFYNSISSKYNIVKYL